MSDGETQKLVDAVADATRTGMGKISRAQLDHGWERLEHSLTEGKYPSVPILALAPRRWLRGFALAAAVLVLGLGTHRLLATRSGGPLHYVVEGTALGLGGSIHTEATAARVLFSDDSRIQVGPATKARVLGVSARGARVALDDGELDVEVRHRRGTSWSFEAGPFKVKVVGTSFHVAFEEQRGRFALRMREGVVEARGPSPDRVFTLRAGEFLELFADAVAKPAVASPSGAVATAPAPAPAAAAPTLGPTPVEAVEPHGASATAHRRLSHPDRHELSPGRWAGLIARGDFDAVVREAESRGLDEVFASASAAELTSLADAARYVRRNDLARQALLGLRARFPGSARASDAAFFLGRLAEQLPSSAAAVAWYETYREESVRGPYEGEALGREMALLAHADRARARNVATAYLERFPHGTQSDLARSLLESAPK
jgi:hypothetical protein